MAMDCMGSNSTIGTDSCVTIVDVNKVLTKKILKTEILIWPFLNMYPFRINSDIGLCVCVCDSIDEML